MRTLSPTPGDVESAVILCSLLAVRRLPAICGAALGMFSLVATTLPYGTASAAEHSPASQLLSDALNAVNQSGSMHFVDKTTVNKTTQTLEGVISAPTAGETLTSSSPLQVELIGGSIYVIGNEEALVQALAITAAQAAPYGNKWIVVQPSDAPFQLLAGDLTIGATIDVFTPAQNGLKIGKLQRIGKIKALPITGTASNLPKGSSGSATLFVSPKSPHIPLGGSLVVANKTGRLSEVAIFDDWGAKVTLTAPTGAIPFSTLLG